jgi:hypothetical protein
MVEGVLPLDGGRRDDGDAAPQLVREGDRREDDRTPRQMRSDALGELHGPRIAPSGRLVVRHRVSARPA